MGFGVVLEPEPGYWCITCDGEDHAPLKPPCMVFPIGAETAADLARVAGWSLHPSHPGMVYCADCTRRARITKG